MLAKAWGGEPVTSTTSFALPQIRSTRHPQLRENKFSATSEIHITCSSGRTNLAFNDGYIDDLPWTARENERASSKSHRRVDTICRPKCKVPGKM